MELPITLQNKIIDFLKSLPNIDDNKGQKAFIYSVGLDLKLQEQIPFDYSVAQFAPCLVSILLKYGKLDDGRNALETVLETAKNYVGEDKRSHCDVLIEELRTIIEKKLSKLAFTNHFRESNERNCFDNKEFENKTIYDVVLSFAGEDRNFVREVAYRLQEKKVSVFYDEFRQAELWGKDLFSYFTDIYMKRARFCVMFLSKHYAIKPWPRHERKSAQARELTTLSEYILPVRIDNTEIPGILPTTGYISAKSMNPEQIADLIAQKITSPLSKVGLLDLYNLVWDWGDWIPFANEFISQNVVKADEFESFMTMAGLKVPEFIGHGFVAIVPFEVAEQYCTLLGGRLPNVESLEYLSSLKPALFRSEAFERGWCSYEWTRSVASGDNKRYVIQMVPAGGGKFEYFKTVVGDSSAANGAIISFRIAVLKPPT